MIPVFVEVAPSCTLQVNHIVAVRKTNNESTCVVDTVGGHSLEVHASHNTVMARLTEASKKLG